MSIFSISHKHKSPDVLRTPRIPAGLLQLPSTIKDRISSYLTPKMAPQLVSRSFTTVLPIQHLNLSGSRITDEGFINLTKNCKDTLISINLCNCQAITEKTLIYLASFKRLVSLNISDNNQLASQGFKHIEPRHSSLSDFLFSMGLTQRAKPSIPFPHLKKLNVSKCGLIAIQDLPKSLTSLGLYTNNVNPHFIGSGRVLEQISHLENLTWLQLEGRESLFDEDLRHLSRLPHLSTLRLINGLNNLSGNCLLYLARLENLTSLDVVACNIPAQDLQQLVINKWDSHYRKDVLNYFKESRFLVDDLHPIIGDYLTPPFKVTKDGLDPDKLPTYLKYE